MTRRRVSGTSRSASLASSTGSREPAKFVQLAASLLPKDMNINNERPFVVIVPATAASVEEWLAEKPASSSRFGR